jgi:hypothetical protein
MGAKGELKMTTNTAKQTDYLLTIGELSQTQAPSVLAERLASHTAYCRQLASSGALLDAGQLRPSREGKRMWRRGDELKVQDGPFDGSIARYYLLRAADLEAATQLARECPHGVEEIVDLRPVMKGSVHADKLDQPGKVFAFSVLGNAPDEAAWIDIMNRIDDNTQSSFPTEGRCGGLRLEAPKTGRRFKLDKRGWIDGPFLESKEVIGGLFFLRMASMDDALRWASTQPFVSIGGLEIRELWRT